MNALASHVQVVAAGSPQQVADAMRDAEQYKEPLLERAVLVIPLPIYEGEPAAQEDGASNSSSSAEQAKVDLRYATIFLWVRNKLPLECIIFTYPHMLSGPAQQEADGAKNSFIDSS